MFSQSQRNDSMYTSAVQGGMQALVSGEKWDNRLDFYICTETL
jgi:hypothetical protein